MIEDVVWAARHNTGLLIRLTPKGIVFSFLCFEDMAASNRITRCGGLYISLTPKLTHHLTAYKCLPHMSNIKSYSNNMLHTILLACAVKTQTSTLAISAAKKISWALFSMQSLHADAAVVQDIHCMPRQRALYAE